MGFYITTSGNVSYTVADEQFEVDSSDLVPGTWKKTGEAQFKGDNEEYSAHYVAKTPHGAFTYTVNLSVGESGTEITSLETEFPDGLCFNESTMEFHVVQGEDEDDAASEL